MWHASFVLDQDIVLANAPSWTHGLTYEQQDKFNYARWKRQRFKWLLSKTRESTLNCHFG